MADLLASYNWAVDECNKPDVGYSQTYRNQQTVNGITYYDCSSFLWYALRAGGFDVTGAYEIAMGFPYSGNAITTQYEHEWLLALGFQEVPVTGIWKPGNTLWRTGHSEMVYEGGEGEGRTMGAHDDERPLAEQVSINDWVSSASSWEKMYEYNGGVVPTKPRKMPIIFYLRGLSWR